MSVATNYLEITVKLFGYYKDLAEKSIAQLSEEQLHQRPDDSVNNIATLVKHMAGNMLSRFTDFLTTDGEKDWRNRDDEFEDTFDNRDELLNRWNQGWNCLLTTIMSLKPEDCEAIVYIRNEGHTVLEAIARQLAHYSYHCGQIVSIAKAIKLGGFKSLSIPKGGSQEFNQAKFNAETERKFFTDGMNK